MQCRRKEREGKIKAGISLKFMKTACTRWYYFAVKTLPQKNKGTCVGSLLSFLHLGLCIEFLTWTKLKCHFSFYIVCKKTTLFSTTVSVLHFLSLCMENGMYFSIKNPGYSSDLFHFPVGRMNTHEQFYLLVSHVTF